MKRNAISWIQSQCIIKDLCLEINFLACTLFYCYAEAKAPET